MSQTEKQIPPQHTCIYCGKPQTSKYALKRHKGWCKAVTFHERYS